MIPSIVKALQEGLRRGLLYLYDPPRLLSASFLLVLYVLDGVLKRCALLRFNLFALRLFINRFVCLAGSGACGINRLLSTSTVLIAFL